jgi:acetyl-CoA carboxylase alpha subunit
VRTLDEIKANWRKVIQELKIANLEYAALYEEIFTKDDIAGSPTFSFDDLKAASDKIMVAREKERMYMMQYLEAVRKSGS